MYTERLFQYLEMATEFTLLAICVLIQECLRARGSDLDTLNKLGNGLLALLIVIITVNALYISYVSIKGCIDKLRQRKLDKRKLLYAEAEKKQLKIIYD